MIRSILTFLYYQRRLILFYLSLMIFVTCMLLVEPKLAIQLRSIVYIHIVSMIFLILYLTYEFILIRRRFVYLEDHIQNGRFIGESFKMPKTYEAALYESFFNRMDQQHDDTIQMIKREKKDALDFMTTWFHEIKTPIAVSRLLFEKDKQNEALQSIAEEMDIIETHVEQALYFMKTDTFNYDYFIAHTDLKQLVREVIVQHAKVFIKKKISLQETVAQTAVTTDKKWLAFVLSQILTNALKYTATAGEIHIFTESDTNETRLVIKDNGIGIEQADLGRIFEKGFTGMNGRAFGKSTGMGLHLADRLAKKLGHRLSATSVENTYTTITIHFPKEDDYLAIH